MKLHDYLNSPGSITASELTRLIGVKGVAQIRQWQHGYANRLPSPENCVSIEQATGGKVMRWDLRPDDWHRIWPELIGTEGSPEVHPGHQLDPIHAPPVKATSTKPNTEANRRHIDIQPVVIIPDRRAHIAPRPKSSKTKRKGD